MWLYMYLLSVQVKESNAWGAGIGLTQNTYPSFCHVHAKMATNVPAKKMHVKADYMWTMSPGLLGQGGGGGGAGGEMEGNFQLLTVLMCT